MKNRLLQILTSLSSLFPDKFLSNKKTHFNKWNEYKSEPQQWALSAKNEKGQWVEIDYRYYEQPGGNSASKTYEARVPGTYQEFKLKVVNYNGSLSGWKAWWGADLRLRIAELVFHEN